MADGISIDKLEIEISAASAQTAQEIDKLSASLSRLQSRTSGGISGLKDVANNVRDVGKSAEEAKKLTDSLERLRQNARDGVNIKVNDKGVKSASNSVSGLGKLLKSVGRVAFYRAIRTGIKEFTDAVRVGMNNAYQWSSLMNGDLAAAFDNLASKSMVMKNQVGAAFATLLQTIAPILVQIINLVAKAAEVITQFIAALGGRTTYLKANPDYLTSWGAAADSAAGSAGNLAEQAKEAKRQLMGFDEINRLEADNDNDSGRGGGGGGGGGVGDMFTEAEIDSGIQNIAAKIRKLFDDIKAIWDEYKPKFKMAFDDVFLKWGDDLNAENIVEKGIVGLFAILGGVAGFKIGGVPGAFVGTLLGGALGLTFDALTFDHDGKISKDEIFKMVTAALNGLVGGAIGFKVGGVKGAAIGAALGVGLQLLFNELDPKFEIAGVTIGKDKITNILNGLVGGYAGLKLLNPEISGINRFAIGMEVGFLVTGAVSLIKTIAGKDGMTKDQFIAGLVDSLGTIAAAGIGFAVGGPLGAAITLTLTVGVKLLASWIEDVGWDSVKYTIMSKLSKLAGDMYQALEENTFLGGLLDLLGVVPMAGFTSDDFYLMSDDWASRAEEARIIHDREQAMHDIDSTRQQYSNVAIDPALVEAYNLINNPKRGSSHSSTTQASNGNTQTLVDPALVEAYNLGFLTDLQQAVDDFETGTNKALSANRIRSLFTNAARGAKSGASNLMAVLQSSGISEWVDQYVKPHFTDAEWDAMMLSAANGVATGGNSLISAIDRVGDAVESTWGKPKLDAPSIAKVTVTNADISAVESAKNSIQSAWGTPKLTAPKIENPTVDSSQKEMYSSIQSTISGWWGTPKLTAPTVSSPSVSSEKKTEIQNSMSTIQTNMGKWWGTPKLAAPTVTKPTADKTTIQSAMSTIKSNLEAWWGTPKALPAPTVGGIDTASVKQSLDTSFSSLAYYWSQKTLPAFNVTVPVFTIEGSFDTIAGTSPTVKTSSKIVYSGWYAEGGFPEDGLFFANSGELVGKFSNGKTAVANNEQIVEGIAAGVYNAVTSALRDSGNTNGDGAQITVNIGDETVYDGFVRYQQRRSIALGV